MSGALFIAATDSVPYIVGLTVSDSSFGSSFADTIPGFNTATAISDLLNTSGVVSGNSVRFRNIAVSSTAIFMTQSDAENQAATIRDAQIAAIMPPNILYGYFQRTYHRMPADDYYCQISIISGPQ